MSQATQTTEIRLCHLPLLLAVGIAAFVLTTPISWFQW